MYLPSVDDENTTLANYLEVQLDAIRDASHGLSDEQARSRPLASGLTLAGLLKHAAYCMVGALSGAGRDGDSDGLVDLEDFYGSFTVADDRSLAELLQIYDELKARYLDLVRELDLDQVMSVPPMPWYGMTEPRDASMRYMVVHHIEEFARHAGHADIIREQIDGAQAASLNAAVNGRPANDFVKPWQPA